MNEDPRLGTCEACNRLGALERLLIGEDDALDVCALGLGCRSDYWSRRAAAAYLADHLPHAEPDEYCAFCLDATVNGPLDVGASVGVR